MVDPSPIPGPDFGKSNGNTYQANQQVAAGYTRVLTATSALDARIGFTWSEANRKPFNLAGENILVNAGIPNAPTDPTISGGLNTQSVTGFSPTWGRSPSTPTTVNPFAINPKVNYSLLHGKHSLKFGYEYQHISTVISNTHPQFGTDTYKGLFTQGNKKALNLALDRGRRPCLQAGMGARRLRLRCTFGIRAEQQHGRHRQHTRTRCLRAGRLACADTTLHLTWACAMSSQRRSGSPTTSSRTSVHLRSSWFLPRRGRSITALS